MRILIAPDKFKGTATAGEVSRAIANVVRGAGHDTVVQPLADGGDGTLDAFGGPNRVTTVTGPDGSPVEAAWRYGSARTAVIEMAQASGLALVGGADQNDAVAATTAGTGELIAEAVSAGAKRVIVGVGGSATTDGGLGALRAMEPLARLRGVDIEVACDVRLTFVEAATRFGPQKGASDAQVRLLIGRLERLGQVYERDFGVDVTDLVSSGAAGGLAAVGGLDVLGGGEGALEEVLGLLVVGPEEHDRRQVVAIGICLD